MRKITTLKLAEQWLTEQVGCTLAYDYEFNQWQCNVKYIRYYPHISSKPLQCSHTMSGKTIVESVHNIRCLIDIEYRDSTDPNWIDRL